MYWISLLFSAVIRDDTGLVVAAASIHKVGQLSVCVAEAMALLEGLKLERAEGVKLVECCLDAISVVSQVNMFSWLFAEEGNLTVEIKEELQK